MYWLKKPEDITFQITGDVPPNSQCVNMYSPLYVVGQLTISSCLPKEDFHVTVCVGDVSKITCSGDLSEDGLTVIWNHPFLL